MILNNTPSVYEEQSVNFKHLVYVDIVSSNFPPNKSNFERFIKKYGFPRGKMAHLCSGLSSPAMFWAKFLTFVLPHACFDSFDWKFGFPRRVLDHSSRNLANTRMFWTIRREIWAIHACFDPFAKNHLQRIKIFSLYKTTHYEKD